MEISNLHSIANSREFKTNNIFKHEVIKAIQTAEGDFACYATASNGQYDQADGLGLGDCFKVPAQLEAV
jgi:hypothetical protein